MTLAEAVDGLDVEGVTMADAERDVGDGLLPMIGSAVFIGDFMRWRRIRHALATCPSDKAPELRKALIDHMKEEG